MKWLNQTSLIHSIGKDRFLAPFPRRRGFPIYLKVFTGAVLGAVSSVACSLGLGDLQAKSYLGQPLQATIQLVSVDPRIDPSSLIIRRMSTAEAEKIGVEVFYKTNSFDFTLGHNPDGGLSVQVVSAEPIKEPFFNLMVELRWPTGVVYRDYPILLDLPPAAFVRDQARRSASVETAAPLPEREPPQATRVMTLPPLTTEAGQYRVASGDTLSTIAARWREGTDQSLADTTAWLFEHNPHAFVNNDINLLRAGATLQMPDLAAYRLDSGGGRPVARRPAASPMGSAARSVAAEPEGEASQERRSLADAATTESSRGMLTVGAATQDDRTQEMIDMLLRENEFLKSRMERIESSEYLETVKSLVLLQRRQISELRARLGVEDNESTAEVERLLADLGLSTVERQRAEQPPQPVLDTAQEQIASSVVEAPLDEPLARPVDAGMLVVEGPRIGAAEPMHRGWLFSALLGAGILLALAFTAMFAYYRRMVPLRGDEEYSDRARMEMPTAGRSFKAESDNHHPSIDYSKSVEASAQTSRPEASTHWLGEQVEVDNFDDDQDGLFTSEDFSGFEDLRLDEAALLMTVEETDSEVLEAAEGRPQDAPVQPLSEVKKAPEADEIEGPETDEIIEAKIERRPDEEVRMSIAEKMAQYDPEDYREELEKLVMLELEELDSFASEGEDDIDALVHQANLYCEFKKFGKARELIESRLTDSEDTRLNAALEQVDNLMQAAEEKEPS